MKDRLLALGIAFLICLSALSAKGEEKSKIEESFYSKLSRGVIRLEHFEQLKREGNEEIKTFSVPDGTGFFVQSADGLFVVTARHIAEQSYDLHARVRIRNITTGKMETVLLQLPRGKWVYHPTKGDDSTHYVDVAAMKVNSANDREVIVFGHGILENGKEVNQLPAQDAEPPQSVLVFGFPGDIGFQLMEQIPLGRSGIVSMVTGKKFLKVDVGGKAKFAEEKACILDVEAFGGNSGSPVINRSLPLIDPGVKLLGLVTMTNRTMNYAIMEPVSRIRETLEATTQRAAVAGGSWFPLHTSSEAAGGEQKTSSP